MSSIIVDRLKGTIGVLKRKVSNYVCGVDGLIYGVYFRENMIPPYESFYYSKMVRGELDGMLSRNVYYVGRRLGVK